VHNEALDKRQSCPAIHVFGARETTVSPGYGSSNTVANLILSSYPCSTSEAITYPACGGQSSYGGIADGNSASQGTTSVANAVNSLHQRCPNTQIVLVGYSQGGQIMENAVCGGPDTGSGITSTTPPISSTALIMVKAVILMGSPRYVRDLSYNVGTCAAQGVRPSPLPLTHISPILTMPQFAARPSGYTCASGAKIQNYCDSPDPYCCTDNDQAVHQGYGTKYGQQALAFVKTKLKSFSGGNPTARHRRMEILTARHCGDSAAGRDGVERRVARRGPASRRISGIRSA